MAQDTEAGALKQWAPVVGLTLSAFIFNTSEFIPIGLLTDIARDFQITESQAGTIITVYAWIVTVLSLPLMLLASKIELSLFIGHRAEFHYLDAFSSRGGFFSFYFLVHCFSFGGAYCTSR